MELWRYALTQRKNYLPPNGDRTPTAPAAAAARHNTSRDGGFVACSMITTYVTKPECAANSARGPRGKGAAKKAQRPCSMLTLFVCLGTQTHIFMYPPSKTPAHVLSGVWLSKTHPTRHSPLPIPVTLRSARWGDEAASALCRGSNTRSLIPV